MGRKTIKEYRVENASLKEANEKVKESRKSAWDHADNLWKLYLDLIIESNFANEALQMSEVETLALLSENARLRLSLAVMVKAYFGIENPTADEADKAVELASGEDASGGKDGKREPEGKESEQKPQQQTRFPF